MTSPKAVRQHSYRFVENCLIPRVIPFA